MLCVIEEEANEVVNKRPTRIRESSST